MKYVILLTQWINFLLIVCETWLVFKNMKKKDHYYLFVNCIALIIYSLGSLLMLFVETDESLFISFMFTWAGKVGVVISMLFFCITFSGRRLPAIVTAIESCFAVASYVIMVTTRRTGLFYKNLHFEKEGDLMIAVYSDGPWKNLWNIAIVVIIVTCFGMMIKALSVERVPQKRNQYIVVLSALLIEIGIGFLTELPIGKYYDFNQLGFSIIVILVMIAIFRNDFMDAEAMAKDYVIDELSAGVIVMGANETVAYCNKTALQIFPDIVRDEQGVITRIEHSIGTGEPIIVEDKVYNFEVRNLVHKSSGESKMYVIIDSTKHYQHLREVEKEKQIANAANRAKSEFLASMSHEIRTPINAVLGMDEMILRECKDSTIRGYATDIQTAGRTLLAIINEVLDFNKIESGKMEIVPVEYDVSHMIDDISNMIKLRIGEKEISFNVSVSSDIPKRMYGDDVRIRQVLLNLLTNAVKYTLRGEIWFRVDLKQNTEGESKEEVTLHYEVEDTGIGIKQEDMNKLFAEFERIEPERSRNTEGTGLGIPITTRLLALMGSELEIKSVYGKGSVFSFDLRQKVVNVSPAADDNNMPESNESEPDTYKEAFIIPDAKLLLVDDNVINRRVFTLLLKQLQAEIIEADSGYKAVELAAERHFDLIFMDHMMPGMDGIVAMEKIRAIKDGPCANTPIVVLTANAIAGVKEKYLEAGFDGYLSKPIVMEELLGTITKMLPKEKVKPIV